MMTKTHLSVLFVEDDPDDVRLVQSALGQASLTDFELKRADSFAAARESLTAGEFDAILLDLGVPDGCGLELLCGIRQADSTTPVVLLTDGDDDATAMEAIAKGAQDYLHKGEITPSSLQRVLRYAVRRQQMLVQLQTANELLDQKNKHLAQLYEAAHQFVDHVSHEFRTPLTVIKEFSSIMRDGLAGQISEKQREFLDIVNDRADDLAIIVDDMLDVSKLEAGVLSVWRQECRIADVFEHVRSTLQRKAAIKSVSLDVSLEDDLPVVFCDPDKIGRVIVNLVVNAIKFCGNEGQVRLWARHCDSAPEVVIGVTDDGPGIAPENLELVFKRFHQLEAATRSSTKGFGLGLSIAKELVSLNFGQIDVESEPGRGSTFRFSVPACDQDELLARCLRRIEQLSEGPPWATLMVAAAAPPLEPAVSNVVDEFLQHTFRGNDLVLRVLPHRWLVITACREQEVEGRRRRVRKAWDESKRNRPGGLLPDLDLQALGTWRVDTQRDQILRQVQRPASPAEDGPRRSRVLVVDDDAEMVRGLEIRLTAAGFEVLTALDGRSAIRRASECQPDVILMDNYMPGMDGLDAMIWLAEQPRTKDIPVVMISASVRGRRQALEHGARFFLQKPCHISTIVGALRKVIEEPALLTPAQSTHQHDEQNPDYSGLPLVGLDHSQCRLP
ncbi:MAG: response regulator [Pirellulales bacterium]|nr:response regulator [Pirellulales bacterium]